VWDLHLLLLCAKTGEFSLKQKKIIKAQLKKLATNIIQKTKLHMEVLPPRVICDSATSVPVCVWWCVFVTVVGGVFLMRRVFTCMRVFVSAVLSCFL